MKQYQNKKLLRALCFFLVYFCFFFNRVARYTQSKEDRNLLNKIPQITRKAISICCLCGAFKAPLFSAKRSIFLKIGLYFI